MKGKHDMIKHDRSDQAEKTSKLRSLSSKKDTKESSKKKKKTPPQKKAAAQAESEDAKAHAEK